MKICDKCGQEQPEHFFIKDTCIPCCAKAGMTAEVVKREEYEVVEDKGCAGGACTL